MRVKRLSKLAQWFTAYLISSTFSLALTSTLLVLGLLLKQRVPLEIALGTFTFFYAVLTVLYLETAVRTRSPRKMLFYPILDITRGVGFTLGGLAQLMKEPSEPEESDRVEIVYSLELTRDLYPFISVRGWFDERSPV